MGFEYKMKATFNEKNKTDIQKLYPKKNEEWEDEYIFETDGLYILKYSTSKFWIGLEELKKYLEENHIKYEIEEL